MSDDYVSKWLFKDDYDSGMRKMLYNHRLTSVEAMDVHLKCYKELLQRHANQLEEIGQVLVNHRRVIEQQGDIIQHQKKVIGDLVGCVGQLTGEIARLKEQLYYMPGGPAYDEAKLRFDEMVGKLNQLNVSDQQ